MNLFKLTLFILFIIYLIESGNGERGISESAKGDKVRGGKSEDVEEYEDGGVGNSIPGKSENGENSTETGEDGEFPNEVFLSLRNITADAASAFRSFTNRNDVVDLQASASDNLNATTNGTFGDAETAGINLRALRDAGHPPLVVEDTLGAVQLPYKHTKIDTADLSDCALQGEWKPMGVAHGHLHVSSDAGHQADVLQSVGSYAVPSKVIPNWQQDLGSFQDGGNGKPTGLYSGGSGYYGSGSGSGFVEGGGNAGVSNHHHQGFPGSLGHFQKIKSSSMLAPPPVPPIIFGKRPGYWKIPKTKHKFFPPKSRRPGGGSYGYSSQSSHGVGFGSGHFGQGGSGAGGGGLGNSGHGVRGGGGGGASGHAYGSGVGGVSVSGGSNHAFGNGGVSGSLNHGYGSGGGSFSSSSNHGSGSGAGSISGSSSLGYGSGAGSVSESLSHTYGSGAASVSGSSSLGYGDGAESISGGSGLGYGSGAGTIYDGGDGSLSTSDASGSAHILHGFGGGAIAGHLVAAPGVISPSLGAEKDLSSGSLAGSGHLIPDSGGGQPAFIVHAQGGINAGHLVSLNQGAVAGGASEMGFITTDLTKPSGGGGHYADSTFSSTQVTQGSGNSLPDAAFLSSHINQDFAVHGQAVLDDPSTSSTFTCGKNHDHNTNYHTATFQVADHDHPSSVDVLQYGGDSAVLIQSGDASFHDQILPERKHYKTTHLSDTSASGSDNRNELANGQTAQLTSQPTEDVGQTEPDPVKIDDGEEPERHSYYHEITKVTKIPATSVGSVEYTFSKYETKPQTFSTESDAPEEEPEVEQPQIIRELEHLSNKFQLDMENPQKLFEDPPSQELAHHYPFQEVEVGKVEGAEGVSEFPYQFYQNKPPAYKKPIVKYVPRPGKPYFPPKHHQPKPLVVLRKHKPKQLIKKQNYEVQEHSGERHRPIGEIFPPQKFPKQFHNPKPNFAVDRPKGGWRPDAYQEYKYEHSHGKKVKKYRTKGKLIAAPILIRRPVSPAPIIRVVEVTG